MNGLIKIMEKNFEKLFETLDSHEAKIITENFNKEYRKYSHIQLADSIKDEENETNDYSPEYIENLKENQKFIDTFNFTPFQLFFLTFHNFIYYGADMTAKWLKFANFMDESWMKLFNNEEFILKALKNNNSEFKHRSSKSLDDLIIASEDYPFDNITVILKNILEAPKNKVINNYSLSEFIEYVKMTQRFTNQSDDEFNGVIHLINRILELNVKPETLLKQFDKNVDNTFGDVLDVYLTIIKVLKKSNEINEKIENDFDKAIDKLFSSSIELINRRVNYSAVSQEYTVDYISMTKDFEEAFPNGLIILSQMLQELGKVIMAERFKNVEDKDCVYGGELKHIDYKYFIENYNNSTPMEWLVELTHH